MNILVVWPWLLCPGGEISSDVMGDVRRIFIDWLFDGILLIGCKGEQPRLGMEFAKVFNADCPADADVMTGDVVDVAVKRFAERFGGDCSFTVLCGSDETLKKIAKTVHSDGAICFLSLGSDESGHDFQDISSPEDSDCWKNCNFFSQHFIPYKINGSTGTER